MAARFLVFFLLSSFCTLAQERPVKLTYARIGEDGPTENTREIMVYKGVAKVGKTGNGLSGFIDYNRKEKVELLYENDIPYKTVIAFDSLAHPYKQEATTEKVLGYTARKSTFSVVASCL